jgi:hypothetical protein
MKALKITGMAVGGLALFAGFAVLIAWILSLLWNWLMPGIFGLPEISMLQAAGLFILSKIIFTPGMGGGSKGKSKHSHHKDNEWKRKFRSKMEKCEPHQDTPEETQA